MLRLEDMLSKLRFFAEGTHEFDHHTALLIMFQILEVLDRSELKTDLLQELDRQKQVLESLRGNPTIAQEMLEPLLEEINQTANNLRAMNTRLGQPLRDNDWLMIVKQRAVIPGGVCEFDVPSYHYWLGLPIETRQQALNQWFAPLQALQDALGILLRILRGSGDPVICKATNGAYQKMLSGGKPVQMVRVTLADDAVCFPDVSANKYAIGIRFSQLDGSQKPRPCDVDVDFELSLCSL